MKRKFKFKKHEKYARAKEPKRTGGTPAINWDRVDLDKLYDLSYVKRPEA